MTLGWRTLLTRGLIAAGLVVAVAGTGHAFFLAAKSVPQKNRMDINAQGIKYLACLVKAAQGCEKSGASIEQECDLTTGTATPPADSNGKFVTAIGKCDAKFLYMKKAGKDVTALDAYEALGCPGDSDDMMAGSQRYTDMIAFQDATKPTLKETLNTLAGVLATVTGCNNPMIGDLKAQTKCLTAETKRLVGYTAAIQKCQLACENDYANKKGNGGPVDTPECALDEVGIDATNTSGALTFNTCVDKAWAKAVKKTPWPMLLELLVIPQVHTAFNGTATSLYNSPGNCS